MVKFTPNQSWLDKLSKERLIDLLNKRGHFIDMLQIVEWYSQGDRLIVVMDDGVRMSLTIDDGSLAPEMDELPAEVIAESLGTESAGIVTAESTAFSLFPTSNFLSHSLLLAAINTVGGLAMASQDVVNVSVNSSIADAAAALGIMQTDIARAGYVESQSDAFLHFRFPEGIFPGSTSLLKVYRAEWQSGALHRLQKIIDTQSEVITIEGDYQVQFTGAFGSQLPDHAILRLTMVNTEGGTQDFTYHFHRLGNESDTHDNAQLWLNSHANLIIDARSLVAGSSFTFGQDAENISIIAADIYPSNQISFSLSQPAHVVVMGSGVTMHGSAGHDTLRSYGKHNVLYGLDGNDLLYDNFGAEVLVGGVDNDVIMLKNSDFESDTIVFTETNNRHDSVHGFGFGFMGDLLDFSALDVESGDGVLHFAAAAGESTSPYVWTAPPTASFALEHVEVLLLQDEKNPDSLSVALDSGVLQNFVFPEDRSVIVLQQIKNSADVQVHWVQHEEGFYNVATLATLLDIGSLAQLSANNIEI